MPTVRRRLDAELVRRRLVPSRESAQRAIAERRVLVSGAIADKAARLVAPEEPLELAGDAPRFVSRGGEKLDAALDAFGVDPTGLVALDAGASTGGFTDCLLQRGATAVVAIDVGHGQLHERLRADRRVESHERTNIRDAEKAIKGRRFPLVVADLSFISLATVADGLLRAAADHADLVLLVKPQFEAGRDEASKGRGVITDPAIHERTVAEVIDAYAKRQATHLGTIESPITGADGNHEFLIHLRIQEQTQRAAS